MQTKNRAPVEKKNFILNVEINNKFSLLLSIISENNYCRRELFQFTDDVLG